MQALVQSRKYLRGYWWAFVGRWFLLALITGALMLVVYLPICFLRDRLRDGWSTGLILVFLGSFSCCYLYEIFDNFRRLKPNAAEEAAKAKRTFLTVSMVIGIVGAIAGIVLIVAISVLFPILLREWKAADCAYYPSVTGTSTVPGEAQFRMFPMSGSIGTAVTLSNFSERDEADTVLMNGDVAARDIFVSASDTLTFTIPVSLSPDYRPDQDRICPKLALPVVPGEYKVDVMSGNGVTTAPVTLGTGGIFTVTGNATSSPSVGR